MCIHPQGVSSKMLLNPTRIGLGDVLTYFDTPTNWSTQIFGLENSAATVTTTVNCFDNPPLRP